MDIGRDRDCTVAGTDIRTCHHARGWRPVDGRRLRQLGPLLWRNLALVWRRRVLGAHAYQHNGLWFFVGSKVPGHVLFHVVFSTVTFCCKCTRTLTLENWLWRIDFGELTLENWLWRIAGELGSVRFLPGDFRRAFPDRGGGVQALSRRLDSRAYFHCLLAKYCFTVPMDSQMCVRKRLSAWAPWSWLGTVLLSPRSSGWP
jgi:hypothetical protein